MFTFLFLMFFVGFVFFLLLFVVLPVASPLGDGTRQRPDGGARQRLGPGHFACIRLVFFLSFRSLLWIQFFSFFALALSPYMLPFPLFIYPSLST